MKEKLIACLNAEYDKAFSKAEAMHRVLHFILADKILTIAEKMGLLFVPVEPSRDIRPFYSHISELRQKDHPIFETVENALATFVEYYLQHLDAQADLLALDSDSFNCFMFAKLPEKAVVITRFFNFKFVLEELAHKITNPNLIARIIRGSLSQTDRQAVKDIGNNFTLPAWKNLINQLILAKVDEQQLYEIQFLYNPLIVDAEVNDPEFFAHKRRALAEDVTLIADWLKIPNLAIPRLQESAVDGWQTSMTLLRFGQKAQVTAMLALINAHLDNIPNKMSYLESVFFKKNDQGFTALCELDAVTNGALMLNQIEQWVNKRIVDGKFIYKLLMETGFVDRLVADSALPDEIVQQCLIALDSWVRAKLISGDMLLEFMVIRARIPVFYGGGLSPNKLLHSLLMSLAVQKKRQGSYQLLLTQINGWLQDGLLDKRDLWEIVSKKNIPLEHEDYVYHLQKNDVFDVLYMLIREKAPALQDFLNALHGWIDRGFLSTQQLETLLRPESFPDALCFAMQYSHNDEATLSALMGLWQWLFRCFGEGKIQLKTLISLFNHRSLEHVHHHYLASHAIYGSDLQMYLVQQCYWLLNHLPPTDLTEECQHMKIVLRLATKPKSTKVSTLHLHLDGKEGKSKYIKEVKNPPIERTIFYIALDFYKDEDILKTVSKDEIFDAILAIAQPQIKLALLQHANIPETPLGHFFKLGHRLSLSRFFSRDPWPSRLQEALASCTPQPPCSAKSSKEESEQKPSPAYFQPAEKETNPKPVATSSSSSSTDELKWPSIPSDKLDRLEAGLQDAESDCEEDDVNEKMQAVMGV